MKNMLSAISNKKLITVLAISTSLLLAACDKGASTEFIPAKAGFQENKSEPSSTPIPANEPEERIDFSYSKSDEVDQKFPHMTEDYSRYANTYDVKAGFSKALLNRGAVFVKLDPSTNSVTAVRNTCDSGQTTEWCFFSDTYNFTPTTLDLHTAHYEVRIGAKVIKTFEFKVKPDLLIEKDTEIEALIGDKKIVEIGNLFINSHATLYLGAFDYVTIKATNVITDGGTIANFTDEQVQNYNRFVPNILSGGSIRIETDYFAGPLKVKLRGRNGSYNTKGGEVGFFTFRAKLAQNKYDYTEITVEETPGLDFGNKKRDPEDPHTNIHFDSFITYN